MSALFSAPKPPGSLPPLPKLDDPKVRRRRENERLDRQRRRGSGSTILTGGLAKALEAAAPAHPDTVPEEAPTVFGLKGRVGRGRANDFADVKAAKSALAKAGYYPDIFAREADGHVDSRMRIAILGFQNDRGLRVDGWMGSDVISISSDVYEQDVMLTGSVEKAEQKAQAGKLAAATEGVKKVYNEIMVVKPIDKEKGAAENFVDDTVIETKINAQLLDAIGVNVTNFRWRSVGGNVFLFGRALSAEERDKATSVVKGIDNVVAVTNRAKVRAKE